MNEDNPVAPVRSTAVRHAEIPEVELPEHHRCCYVCGRHNEGGLRARQTRVGDRVILRFRSERCHQNASGLLHGGVISALMDEALGSVPGELLGVRAATGTLTVVYRLPVLIGSELNIEASLSDIEGRKLHLRGTARTEDGLTVAEATGIFIVIPE